MTSSFDIYTNPFVKELSKHPDWQLMTKETRLEKSGRLKFVCKVTNRRGERLYGTIYISTTGMLHYEHKSIQKIRQGRRRALLISRRMQQRRLPETYKQLLSLLRELNELNKLMADGSWFHGWDGAIMPLQKLYMSNVN